MYIDDEEYQRCLAGFVIVDCVVRSRSLFYFVVREDYTRRPDWQEGDEPPAEEDLIYKVILCGSKLAKEQRWGYSELYGFAYLLAGATRLPREQFVGVDMGGQVYVLGSGKKGIEQPIDTFENDGLNRGTIMKSRNIGGSLYVCGFGRSVGRRDEREVWHSYTHEIPSTEDDDIEGFSDIDGFDERDIYCVGGQGDVWHFNGKEWLQVLFPSNIDLYTVCCGGDGFVYISGYGGTTFKGRGDKWERIFEDNLSIPFRDMVWYEDKVWCTNEYGFWTIEKDKLQDADVDSSVLVCAGNLSVADNVMLLAGYEGIAYRENGEWHKIL